jgi:hypothetical protein
MTRQARTQHRLQQVVLTACSQAAAPVVGTTNTTHAALLTTRGAVQAQGQPAETVLVLVGAHRHANCLRLVAYTHNGDYTPAISWHNTLQLYTQCFAKVCSAAAGGTRQETA